MRGILLFFLIVPVFLFNPLMPRGEINHPEILTEEEIHDIFYEKTLEISETLMRVHETDLNGNYKWKKILNAPNSPYLSDQYFPGLYSGVAGLGYYFLKMYEYSKNQTYLEVAQKAADYVYSQRKYSDDLIYWSRSEYALSDSYTSQKYGTAGISDFFLSMYKISKNITYLSYSEQVMNSLLKNALNSSDVGKQWGYSFFDSIPLTGLTYGVTGISASLLNLYQYTKTPTYLQDSLKSMEWVLSLSSTNNNSNILTKSILYSNVPEYPYNYTGFSSGVSGIGAHFLHLFSVTEDFLWLDYALQIGNWLIENEHNGLWFYGGVDYLTDSYNEDGSFLGLSAGSAGIGLFLLDLYAITNKSNYKNSSYRIFNQLIDSSITSNGFLTWPVQKKGFYHETITTGLGNGISGVGLFFNKFYRIFKNDLALNNILNIHNFLENLTTNENLIPFQVKDLFIYYDSSFFEGLAGIGLFYLDSLLSLENENGRRDAIFDDNYYFKSYENFFIESNNYSSNEDQETINSVNGINLLTLFIFIFVKCIIIKKKSKYIKKKNCY